MCLNRRLKINIISSNYKQGLKRRCSFKNWIQTLSDCTGCKTKRIGVKPKIFKSVSEYLSNEYEKSNFHSGKQKLWPNEFSERSLWKLYSPRKWSFCKRPRNSTKPLLLDPRCEVIDRFQISLFLKLVCECNKGKCVLVNYS